MTLLSDQAEDIRALVGRADPGAVWAVGGPEGTHAGSHPRNSPESGDTLFDVGGLAAVLALWPVVGSLVEEGALQLHTPLAAYGDPAASRAPAGTTAHHLLTHCDGAAALTGLAEHLGGGPLPDLAATRVWQPLGMTGTRFEAGTLRAPLADLVRFLCHVVSPAGAVRAWAAESLRIRTGELTPARGLLWQPAPHGVWAHPGPAPGGPALWVCPSRRRWALLLPGGGAATSLRSTFRDAVFRPNPT